MSEDGNIQARKMIEKYFEPAPAFWRGIGKISGSGLVLRREYVDYSVEMPLEDEVISDKSSGCRCGEVITGRIEPHECPLFGKICTPSKPVGPCMVSQEGTCGIHYSGC
ncbi:MAG: Hydrogenase expression/formation protein HypD [Firmicutes bacterium ADurb.Bin419]|nr:MAG: Hydrogenase expression/formation protein HypD [Firmicutes bacterium ADurb.Bin419]